MATGNKYNSELDLQLDNASPEEIFSNANIYALMQKYGKSNTSIPPDKRNEFKSEGFRVRFRLSKAYRTLEKQEAVGSRPVFEKPGTKKRKQKMADIMMEIETQMQLPDPDEKVKSGYPGQLV